MAQTYNIHVDQGSTYTLTVNYTDAAGAPVNLTGYEARMQVRLSVKEVAALASFTSPAGGLVVSAGAGTIVLTIPSDSTAAYAFTNAVYDLEIYDASVPPVVIRMVQGRFVINPEVTR